MRIAPRREVGAPDIDSACRKSHRLLGARTDASLRSSLAALRREVDVREENSTCTFIHIKNQVFLSLRIHLQWCTRGVGHAYALRRGVRIATPVKSALLTSTPHADEHLQSCLDPSMVSWELLAPVRCAVCGVHV